MKRNVFTFIICLIYTCVQAQVHSSEACFYLEAGKDPNSSSSVWKAIRYKGNKVMMEDLSSPLWRIQDNLKKDCNYYEKIDVIDTKTGFVFEYDNSTSTKSMVVYKRHNFMGGQDEFIAVSRENSRLIFWYEERGKIFNKKQYIRIDKSEVLPKGINRDFLE
jgi:hypothetical protein